MLSYIYLYIKNKYPCQFFLYCRFQYTKSPNQTRTKKEWNDDHDYIMDTHVFFSILIEKSPPKVKNFEFKILKNRIQNSKTQGLELSKSHERKQSFYYRTWGGRSRYIERSCHAWKWTNSRWWSDTPPRPDRGFNVNDVVAYKRRKSESAAIQFSSISFLANDAESKWSPKLHVSRQGSSESQMW